MQEWQITGRRGDRQQNLIYIKSSQLQANKNQEIGLPATDVVVGRQQQLQKDCEALQALCEAMLAKYWYPILI